MRPFCFLAIAVLSACPDRTISEVVPDQQGVESKAIPLNVNRDIDILFVIDKSPTMTDEQASLTANFPRFIQVLQQIEGGLPNIHLGVISQDIGAGGLAVGGTCTGAGDAGNLLATPRLPGCQAPGGRYIVDVEQRDGGRTTNYTGSLADAFACVATLGPSGCGFEQHLGSLKKALIGNPANAGFLRPEAYLAIIFISDEDDCTAHDATVYDPSPALTSQLGPLADFRCFEWGWECDEGTLSRTQPGSYTNCRPRMDSPYLVHPDQFVDDIKGLKDDADKILVATLIGPRPQDLSPPEPTRVAIDGATGVAKVRPSCGEEATQHAFPMPRLFHFAQQFARNRFFSLCENDLSAGLAEVGDLIRDALGNPCLETEVDRTDTDAQNPGLQLSCTVTEVAYPGKPQEQQRVLPPCTMADPTTPAPGTPQPCWYVVSDAEKCAAYPTTLAIATHPADRATPVGTRLEVQCVTTR